MDEYQQPNQGAVEQTAIGTIHHNLADLMPASSEIGHLWAAYQAENMSVCFLKKWVNYASDPEIHLVLQEALDASSQRIKAMDNLFHTIQYPLPLGFGENDVDINSPMVFSQTFCCLYTRMTQKMVMHHYISATTSAYRPDFRSFFSDCLRVSDAIHRKATEILLAKGVLQKHPSIVTPKTLENVWDKNYFGSYFRIFGNERPLSATEISHIYSLIETKTLIRAFNLGCSQVVKSEKIKNFLLKAIEIADKQIEVLGDLLTKQDIPRPSLSEILITDTGELGISERVILCHSTAIIAYITSVYGLAIPNMLRKDLNTTFFKFSAEVLGLARDGAELMVEAGWMEKIPETTGRAKLSH